MIIEEIRKVVDGVPYMNVTQAIIITDVILEHRFKEILELGFCNGVSTCYMAGAIDELGGGKITTIDLLYAQKAQPNIETLLEKLGLLKYVDIFYEPTSYIWRLMKMLEESPAPRYDFCYVDGAHNWATDGFAFFLVDRLLKPGGMIIFDDLDWTYEKSPSLKDKPEVKNMPQDERTTPQVRKVYELLVKPHPSYGDFMEKDGWAFARKLSAANQVSTDAPRKEYVYQKEYVGLGGAILKMAGKFTKK